ncbi:hypothetical protein [Pseudoalteromonas sp. APC 3691]|uniref:hypothetical protein n=1 Tax=Pseudoalteromonas sp. APC 3691 TaxID=3035173 RepID=UPI0025B39FA1|nr:hypothetical protein [Pseudoalteromonas sp. APC 3691]MDN3392861.1 hypothetical protein [Pseudoalteromonas sp. APC 3691]
MSNVCIHDDCTLIGKYNDKCSLHCNKGDYSTDRMSGKLSDFYDDLSIYIYKGFSDSTIKGIFQYFSMNTDDEEKKENMDYLSKNLHLTEDCQTIQQEIIYFRDIIFPTRDSRDKFDFFKLFTLFKGLHFDSSTISFSSLNLPNTQVFFQDCTFKNAWSIHSFSIIEDVSNQTLFQTCNFLREVSSASMENSRDTLRLENYLFNDCKFNKQLSFYRGAYKKNIFNNSNEYIQKISELNIENCEFEEGLSLNKSEVDTLKIQNMVFEGKVELKECVIRYTLISNVNFKSLFDAYKTKFNQFEINQSIFDDFSGFEKCEFGCSANISLKKIEFEYVTFLNFTNFRKAKFHNGLDFEHTNLKESPNFLNAEINYQNTNRETFRILKHSFDKIGNQIEANKYFALEMRKYKEELKTKKGLSAEKAVLWLNESISNFGSSIFTPLFFMTITAIIYYFSVLGYENNCLYKIYEPLNEYIISIANIGNTFAKGIPPYGRFLKEGMEFVTLIYHIFFLMFTWHFIVAVKRCTKR